jgi:hypothetical protein
MEDLGKSRRREKIKDYIDASRKSPVAGVIYALFFGPFGCSYTNPWSTVIALVVAIGLGLIYWPLIALVWVGCMILAPFQVRTYNQRLRRSARYHVG